MEAILDWARGPLFLFALTFMLLGLVRHVVVTAWETYRTYRRASDKALPYARVLRATLAWLFPVRKARNRLLFSMTSIAFHVAIIAVPVFLGGHIALWARGTGLAWPALPNPVADVLTIVGIVTAVALVVQRLAAPATRSLSRLQDVALPLVLALPLASGFLVMHPPLNPFDYHATLLVHVMSGNLVLVLVPITKLSHMVLVPSVHVMTELAWHWPADAGSKLAVALGKEREPV